MLKLNLEGFGSLISDVCLEFTCVTRTDTVCGDIGALILNSNFSMRSQMFHTRAVRWKQRVRHSLCMHLHNYFKVKYLFSQCIGTIIPEHNTKPWANPSCTRFESNRCFRKKTIQKGDIAQEQVHVSLKSRSQAKTHTHTCVWRSPLVHTRCTGSKCRHEQCCLEEAPQQI